MRCARSWPPRPAPAARPGAPTSALPGAFPSQANPQGVASVNARDRIGTGPWYNAKGELIARDVAHLHNGNNLNKETALDEKGNVVKGRGDNPNEHDILTGSRADGTAFAPQTDTTCKAWTSSTEGSADRRPPRPHRPAAGELGQELELLAPVGGLQPGGAGAHRRLGAAVLLRKQLTHAAARCKGPRAVVGALLSLRQTGSGFKVRRARSAAVARWRHATFSGPRSRASGFWASTLPRQHRPG